MQLITPIFLILLSIGIFFGYVDPKYRDIKNDKKIVAQYDEALQKFKELQAIRDDLLSQYDTLNPDDLRRLEKLLPDNIDNVKLIMEIDGMAKRRGISVKDIAIQSGKTEKTPGKTLGPDAKEYDSVVLEFSFGASYENYKAFLSDLESSLRLVDIESSSFAAADSDFSNYKISVRSYWLK